MNKVRELLPMVEAGLRQLVAELDCDVALLGSLSGNTLELAAAHSRDGRFPTIPFALEGTPFAPFLDPRELYVAGATAEPFSGDHSLTSLGLHHYAAIRLTSETGRTLGLLAILGRDPDGPSAEARKQLTALAMPAVSLLTSRPLPSGDPEGETARRLLDHLAGMAYRCRHAENCILDYVTDGALALTGFSPTDLLGEGEPSYRELIHPDDRQVIRQHMEDALGRHQHFQLFYRIHTASGVEKHVWEQGQGVFSATGELTAIEGMIVDVSDRHRAEQAILASEELNTRMLEAVPGGVVHVAGNGEILTANSEACKMLGLSFDELTGRHVQNWEAQTLKEDGSPCLAADYPVARCLATGTRQGPDTIGIRSPDGSVRWAVFTAVPTPVTLSDVDGAVVTFLEITDRIEAETEMRKLSRAVEQIADSVVITDSEGRIEYVNDAFETITGWRRSDVLGDTPRILKSGRHPEEFYQQLWETITEGRVFQDVMTNRKRDGELFYEEKTITPLKNDRGEVTHFVSTGKDVTERMRSQERLNFLANHDVLTNLPNRFLFLERLGRAIDEARRRGGRVAVLYVDLDHFTNLNDTLGHAAGDRALQIQADRLQSATKNPEDVARLAGDEFTILLTDIKKPEAIASAAERVLAALREPFHLEEREHSVTASIGISVFPDDGNDGTALLRTADLARHGAKNNARNGFQFYSADMSASVFERLSLEARLRGALERNEFSLAWQPQVDLESGNVVAVEALLRWNHPELGRIPPAQFIPIAEESELILAIGDWVLKAACAQARRWRDAGLPAIRVAVNLSARQFAQPDLARRILGTLSDAGVDPEALELEVTEGTIMRDSATTDELLRTLRMMGLSLAIDDFGTGYSSLSYLKRFPISTLKIDRSFVRDIEHDPSDAAIVEAIIAMAHACQATIVAEGIETEAQLEFLRVRGCERGQGFLLCAPVPAEELEDRLRQGRL